ncbi:hypothetical protein SAMD00019534_124470 [Acytostelium subglobosum LB1]|uniref:hypothetical protein n=1 Tax=Acytostelium subglobosum LB1 TaxID=1410327 RepID=UPI000644C3B8|nr:hypothetical protein SAMD00019534_124470 [Acytostelium subglobosum LB1]GAM29271.1 hypothetical protein SAMD00019534_124470 [Acytostelium subglobosum LB1]|eukprot:XP_012747769.1 hypothetical protein SAMD00019534_124470 [Acytostelium subglobosum LB1]
MSESDDDTENENDDADDHDHTSNTDEPIGSPDQSPPSSPESTLEYQDEDNHDVVVGPKEKEKKKDEPLRIPSKVKRLQLYKTAVEYIDNKVPYWKHLDNLIKYEESAEYSDCANTVASTLIQKILKYSLRGVHSDLFRILAKRTIHLTSGTSQ